MGINETLASNEHNFFDVEQEFFLIDSENLDNVKTKFYGYSIQRSGIYEEDNLTDEAITGLDGRGAYVYVETSGEKIRIRQDFGGSYGLYLFQQGEYFALSNSFLRLLQHVSRKYPLTVNKDYGHHILTDQLASQSPSLTPVEEISIIDRWGEVYIDISVRKLAVKMLDYEEMSYSLDTPEGMAVLDEWYDFWTDFLRRLSKHTDFMRADLSGGYDSRLSFLLLLCSGADLNGIRIYSSNDRLHTHAEDYRIASAIAEHYGFSLNRQYPQTKWLNYSKTDCINIEAYTKMGFHKEPYIKNHISVDKFYTVMGSAGEAIRERYTLSAKEFIQEVAQSDGGLANKLEKEVFKSVKKTIEDGFRLIEEKYGKPDRTQDYPKCLYRDGWSRSHFGKIAVANHFTGNITLMPLLDPLIWKLRLHAKECSSDNLLMAMIYVRYCPKLMEFPFEGHKYSMTQDTVEAAKIINERFPRATETKTSDRFVLMNRNEHVAKVHSSMQNNPAHDTEEIQGFLKNAFDSSEVKGLFTSCFDEQFYRVADRYYHFSNFFPMRHCSAVLAMANVIRYVLASRVNTADLQRPILLGSLQSCNYLAQDRHVPLIRFRNSITARLDFMLKDGTSQDINIISTSDDLAKWSKPEWLQKFGGGIMLHSSSGILSIVLKVEKKGELCLWLRGVDVREHGDHNKRIPYWLNFKKLIIDGKEIFSGNYPVWHDQPFEYRMKVRAGEKIALSTEWQPHRGH